MTIFLRLLYPGPLENSPVLVTMERVAFFQCFPEATCVFVIFISLLQAEG
jgi:hypothetical protein